jgi:hypothetical protein
MSEEVQEGMSTLKKTLLGVVTTLVTGAGVYITTNINKIFGVEEEEKTEQVQQAPAQAAPIVLNIENNNTQQQNNSGGTRTIVKETIREVPAQPSVPVEEPKESNADRMARLKAQKAKQNDGQ